MDEVYYIRPTDSETARGPFDIDKLNTLAEAGQVTRETLYYDDKLEAWAAIESNEALLEKVFPSRKKLTLRGEPDRRKRSEAATRDDERTVVSVDEMLAAAEGQTEDTHHLREAIRWQHRAAAIAVPILAIVCFVSAATYIYPAWQKIENLLTHDRETIIAIISEPLLVLGLLDLLFGICLALAATEVYPLLRLRAAFGVGYFGFIYWAAYSHGDPNGIALSLAHIAYGVGIFTCTLTLNFRAMIMAGILSLLGALVFAYFTTFSPLVDQFL